jgi:basic membrane lipoprotein Med (substrate-binding protein (PBP1-ABC) superfamily)
MVAVRKLGALVALAVVVGSLLVGCGGAIAPESGPQAEAPTEVNIAAIYISAVEEPWNTSFMQAIERLQEDSPHELTINLDYTENVAPPDAERVMRQYADAGKYDIIWGHSGYYDAIMALKDEYSEILWVGAGSGYEPMGDNAYRADVVLHEPAYLMGIMAGEMTETDRIGAVAAFPYPNVNLPLNAFIDGAKSVNADVEGQVTYIESWYDPPTAKESASALISSGADLIYAERFGPFEACKEEGVLCFGHFVDQRSMAPDVVVTCPVALWDPAIGHMIDEWWAYETEGEAYDASGEPVIFSMAEGGSKLGSVGDMVPDEVMAKVDDAREQILSGDLEVPFDEAPIE